MCEDKSICNIAQERSSPTPRPSEVGDEHSMGSPEIEYYIIILDFRDFYTF